MSLLIILVVGLVVTYPLWRGKSPGKTTAPDPNEDLLAQKEATFDALRELEFDYSLGNLSPQDHRELEREYKDKAVAILKELDSRGKARPGSRSLEAKLEAEVLQVRRSLKEAQPKGEKSLVCPRCATPYQPTDRFCSQCGADLPQMKGT